MRNPKIEARDKLARHSSGVMTVEEEALAEASAGFT
jgi:hypothetical protein